jgi:hypothetical protein
MEAGKNCVIYMGLISGPNKADDTCGPTTVTGTMDRGFTVINFICSDCKQRGFKYTSLLETYIFFQKNGDRWKICINKEVLKTIFNHCS